MEDKQTRDINSGMNSGQSQQIGAMDITPSLSLSTPPVQQQPTPRPKNRSKWKLIGLIVTTALLVGLGVFAFVVAQRAKTDQADAQVAGVSSRYDVQSIELGDAYSPDGINLSTSQFLNVNGQLRVNSSLILAPTTRPQNAVAGQLYFDKATNSSFLYDGTAFQGIVTGDTVRSIGGATGEVVLGTGLMLQNGQLSLSQDVIGALSSSTTVGVTSLQGQTGSVSLNAGAGIAINGTTITNTGVQSVQAASPQLTVTAAGNGVFSIGTVGNMLTGSGSAGRVAVFNGAGDLADSLLSQSGGFMTVDGDLRATGQLQADTITSLTAGQELTISAGGSRLVLVSEGRTFQLPSSGAVNQTICTVGMNCTSGGGASYVLIQPGTVQVDSGTGSAVFINNTGGGNLIQLQGNSLDAFTVANNGDTSVSGTMNVVGTINGATISGGNISGGTVNGATITGGVLSGGSLSAVAVNGLGVTSAAITGSGALTIAAANDQNLTLMTSGTGVVALGAAELQGVGALDIAAGGVDQNLTLRGSGTGSVVINTPRFVGPNGALYTFAATDPGSVNAVICTSVGNCSGSSGGLGGSGTIGTIAVFDGIGLSVGDSLLSQSGTVVTVAGDIAAVSLQGDGAAVTNVNATQLGGQASAYYTNASNINTGTLSDLRVSANIAKYNDSTANFTGALQQNGNAVCTTAGNCAGTGAGVGGSGTDGFISIWTGGGFSLANSILSQSGTTITISGDVVANNLAGNGAGLTGLNATNVTTGTLSDTRLSSNVTLQGNIVNAANGLVRLNASGQLPALNASQLTDLNATALTAGTVSDARLSNNVALLNAPANFTGTSLQFNGDNVCTTAGNCAGTGAGLGGSGTAGAIAIWTGSGFTLGDSLITQAAGVVTVSGDLVATNLQGNGSAVTGVNAAQLGGQAAGYYTNATNISSGTLSDARLSANVTKLGNSVNIANGLVQLNASGQLPSLNGSLLTNLNASNVSGGTLADARLSSNVALLNAPANFTGASLRLNGNDVCTTAGNCIGSGGAVSGGGTAGTLAVWNGSGFSLTDSLLSQSGGAVTVAGDLAANNLSGGGAGLTGLNATNVTTGTLSDTRLSSNVTLQGNIVNAANGLVRLNASGQLPALNASQLTDLNATSIASGTLSDLRLSGNVALLNASANFTGAALQYNGAAVCTTAGNCVGGGGGGVGSGTNGTIAVWTSGGTTLADSLLSQNAGDVVLSGAGNGAITTGGTNQTLTLRGNGTGGVAIMVPTFQNAAGASYTFDTGDTGAHEICTNAGNCIGSGGGVAGSGTSGAVALWNGNSFTLGDSLMTQSGGTVTVAGDLSATNLQGNGSAITGVDAVTLDGLDSTYFLNASNLNTGTLSDARLSSNVTVAGNVFNGANQLVRLNGTGQLPALDGSLLTNVNAATLNGNAASYYTNASNLSSGTVGDARLSGNVALLNAASQTFSGNVNVTGTLRQNGNDVCTTAGNCLGSGGAISGSGTPGSIAIWTGSGFSLGDSILSQSAGTVTVAGDLVATNLQGSGAGITDVDAALLNGQLASFYTNATNLNSGTLSDTRLSSSVTLQGNTFNGANQLVRLDASGQLPAVSGVLVTNINASNIASGTLADGRLSSNVALYNAATANFTGTLQQGGNNVCTTSGNCVGTSGGAIGGSGTANTFAMFNGTGYTIANSMVSQNIAGTLLSVSGQLTASGGALIGGNSVIMGTLSGLTGLTSSGTVTFSGLNAPGVVHTNGSGLLSTSLITNADLQGGAYSAITGTGTLTSGSIASGFGAISTTNNITTTADIQGVTINATGSVQTNGTTRLSGTGALSNITGYSQTSGLFVVNASAASVVTTSLDITASTSISGGLFVSSGSTTLQDTTISSGTQFTNRGSTLNAAAGISNQNSSGTIGIGSQIADSYTTIQISQTTPGLTLALPNPAATTAGRIMYVLNTGTASFTMHGVVVAPGYGQSYIWNGSAWILTAAGGGSTITLQGAYDGGNALNTTNAKNIAFTLTDTATDADFITNIASGSTGRFRIQSNGVDAMSIGASGQLVLSAQGASGGVAIGGDTSLYRSGVNRMQMSNALTLRNTTDTASAFTVQTAAGGDVLSVDTANNKIIIGGGTGSSAKLHIDGGSSAAWTTSVAAEDNAWQDIAYGNGVYVAVASSGTNRVMTSFDGVTWTARLAAEATTWTSVTYGNGTFVAVASSGTNRVMTSPDGVAWTAQTAIQPNSWQDVTYGLGLFVAVSSDGANRVMTSSNGSVWTARSASQANPWASVTYGNGMFVAVAGSGTNRVMTSTNGTSWSNRTAAEANIWTSVTYGGDQFVAVSSDGTNRVMTSPDGISWLARSAAEANSWTGIAYGSGRYVAVSSDGTNRVMTSTDGISWLARSVASRPWKAVTSNASRFIAVATTGPDSVLTSPSSVALRTEGGVDIKGDVTATGNAQFRSEVDSSNTFAVQTAAGMNILSVDSAQRAVVVGSVSAAARLHVADSMGWKSTTGVGGYTWRSIAYGNGTFVAVANSGTSRLMTSPDGITWTARVIPEANSWQSVEFLDGQFVAVAGSGVNRVMTSPDGITWTARLAAAQFSWTDVAFGGGVYAAVANNGASDCVMTSTDGGVTWTTPVSPTVNTWQSITYGNGRFIAVSSNGVSRIMTSTDGITWTVSVAPGSNTWKSVTYANGTFVAVADGGSSDRIMTSPDGVAWTPRTAPVVNQWKAVTYGNGYFLAVSSDGTSRAMTSPDGITWKLQSAVADASTWTSIAYGGGRFVIAGDASSNSLMYTAVAGLDKALLVQDPAGADVLSVDTVTHTVTVSNLMVGANGVIRIVGGDTSTRPANPGEGTMYFDTTTKQMIVYAGGQWNAAGQVNSMVTVATSTSRGRDGADYVVSATDESLGNADATIATAIASLPATGGAIYLMEGTYTIDTGIVIPSNVKFAGAGQGVTIIKLKNGHNADINLLDMSSNAYKTNITIQDLSLDGNKANQTAGTQTGIYSSRVGSGDGATAVSGIAVRNIESSNLRSYGIYTYSSMNGLIDNVALRNNSSGLYLTYNTTRMSVMNSAMTGNTDLGVYTGSASYISLRGNRIVQNGTTGISFEGIGSEGNVVSDNVITQNGLYGIYNTYSRGLTITENRIATNGSGGVYFHGAISESYAGAVISNNNIYSNTGSGIYAYAHVFNGTITGNRVYSNTTYGITLTFFSSVGPDDSSVVSNYVYSNASGGIRLASVTDITVQGNTVSNNGGATTNEGIVVTGSASSNNLISGNNIVDTSCTTSCVAINIGSGAVDTYLSDNKLGGGTIVDAGTATKYANQLDSNGHLINRTNGSFSVGGGSTLDSTLSLQGGMTSTQLPTPAQPTVARTGTAGTTTYGYRIVAVDGTGTSLPSVERTITKGNAVLSATNYNTVTWVGVPGAVSYYIFRTTAGGTPSTTGRIGTVAAGATLSLADTGLAADGSVLPTSNTTGSINLAGYMQASLGVITGSVDTAAAGGVLSVGNANAGTINVATNAIAHTINIGTGAADQTISIGSSTGTSVLNLSAGSGGVAVNSDATSAFKVQSTGAIMLLNVDSVAQKVTVRDLAVTYNITVNGHIISGGSAPTVSYTGDLCGAGSSVTVSGTDTAGKITMNTGSGSCVSSGLASITYNTAYGTQPIVTLTAATNTAAAVGEFVIDNSLFSDNTKFTISMGNVPAPNTQYIWYYHVIQ